MKKPYGLKMAGSPYYTALAHVALVGSSVWALISARELFQGTIGTPLAFVTFGLHLLQSAIGVFRFGNPYYGIQARQSHIKISFVSNLFGFPLIVTQIYFNYKYSPEIAYLHVASTAIPFLAFLSHKKFHYILDGVLVGNILSMLYVSLVNQNFYGIAMCISYAGNYFLIRHTDMVFELPAVDLFTYGTCFFNYFAVKALSD